MPRNRRKLRPVSDLPNDSQAQSTWGLAHSYEIAAATLIDSHTLNSKLPILFLLLHSLELFLKANLILNGISDSKLREIGHDLVKSIRANRHFELGNFVRVGPEALRQVVRVNRYYTGKELEYFAPRSKQFGNIDTLHSTVRIVAKAVGERVVGQALGEIYRGGTAT